MISWFLRFRYRLPILRFDSVANASFYYVRVRMVGCNRRRMIRYCYKKHQKFVCHDTPVWDKECNKTAVSRQLPIHHGLIYSGSTAIWR